MCAQHARPDAHTPGSGQITYSPGAIDAFRALSLAMQREIAAKVVRTRRRQLVRSFPAIRSICVGNKSSGKTARDRIISPTTCVVFIVDNKIDKSELPREKHIPAYLRTWVAVDGRRRYLLVPTDVENEWMLTRARPDAGEPSEITILSQGLSALAGQICCAVSEPGVGEIMAISCRHVLTPDPAGYSGAFIPSTVYLGDDTLEIADATIWGGKIRSGAANAGPWSFDAQLAMVRPTDEARALLRAVIGEISLQNWARSASELPPIDAFVQTTRGPVAIQINDFDSDSVQIDYRGNIAGFHEELIVSRFDPQAPLGEGDSGAAVTSDAAGGILLGMHIASKKDEFWAYAIPAWRLLNPQNYENEAGTTRPAGEAWIIRTPGELPAPPPLTGAPSGAPPALVVPPLGDRPAFVAFAIAATRQLVAEGHPINAVGAAIQAIHETGYGQSEGARLDNAYFGIKASGRFAGTVATRNTTDVENGVSIRGPARFRAYPTWWDSFVDYGDLIGRLPRYAEARALAGGDPIAYLEALCRGGYAPDPPYVDRCRALLAQWAAVLNA